MGKGVLTVQAWQFHEVGRPLTLDGFADPEPGPGQVTIAPEATGFCHTDVGYSDGTITAVLPFTPIVLGHEIAGRITALGTGVHGFRIGDRVAIKAGADSPGNASHGGFATAVVSAADLLVRIPDNVSSPDAAIATDAGLTAYHAVRVEGAAKARDRVGIIGLGGLGYFGAQFAKEVGAEVFVAEPNEVAREHSRPFRYAAYESDITAFAGYDLDRVVEFAGFGGTTAGALNAVREHGKVVQIGIGTTEATISTLALVARQITLVGCVGGTIDDLSTVLDLISRGKVSTRIELVPFSDIPQALDRLAKGGLTSRLVAHIS